MGETATPRSESKGTPERGMAVMAETATPRSESDGTPTGVLTLTESVPVILEV